MKSTFQGGIFEERLIWREQFNDCSESFDKIFVKFSWKSSFFEKLTGWNPITKLKIDPFGGVSQSIFGLALLKSPSSDYFRPIFDHFRITVIIFSGVGSFTLKGSVYYFMI